LAVLDDSIVNELVRMASKAVKAAASTTLAPVDPIATGGRLDVRRWLDRVGAVLLEVDRTTDGTKKWFVQCPGFDRHTTGNGSKDCVITQELSGRMGGCCFHSSCGMGNWQALSHALGRPTADEWGYNESDLHWAAIAERLMAGDAGDVAHCDNQNAIVEAGIPASTNHPAIVGAQNHAATTLADQDDEQTSILPPDETNNLPDELLYPPGFLGEFVRHANDVAYVKQPELALGAAIATLATLIGHKIKDSTGTWSNIYVLALAPSGAGKEMPRDVLKAILQEAAPHLLGADVPASDAAILTGLRTSGSQVLTLDEAGDLFAHMQGRGGGALHMQKIKSVLKTIFTASKTSFKQTYKESKESFEILHPNLSVFATSTPESFWCHGVSHGDVEGGLIGRFLIFDGRVPRTPPMQPDEKPLPEKLIDIAKQWNSYLSIDNMLAPNPRSVTLTDEARRMKKEFSDWNFYTNGDGAHKPQDMTKKTIWRRAAEKVAKLALIHAASRAESPEKVEVDIIDVEWSIAVVKWSITTLLDGAERYMADGAYETNKKKMFRAIEDAGPRGLTGAELAKKGQWLEPRIRHTVLNDLKATGEVVIDEAKPSGRGRPGVFYIAARYRICSKKGRD
jgi:hypothetical protein